MLPSLLLLSLSFLFSAAERPYAGQQERAIKSLSEDEVETYRQGSGMGFVKPAELNHYPGPKHVSGNPLGRSRASRERCAHLAAHLEMKQILTPEQIAKYDALRGYGSGDAAARHHHSPH